MSRKREDAKKEERFYFILVMKDNNKVTHTLKCIGHKLLFYLVAAKGAVCL